MNFNGSNPRPLVIEEGKDYILDDNESLPYILLQNLGHGHSANVEMVQDTYTGAVFARKVFRVSGNRDERRRVFRNEIEIIQRLAKHHHIIRVFATYMSRRETGLILSPVANQGDLESFLYDFRDGRCTERAVYTLVSSFGCLASGLLFMHSQHVRHKDIKPRNILIHNNSVIYTDFGYSLDHSEATGSTTTGRPDTLTRKYCAPEVQDWSPRNAKSDIFSLACVYFEIFSSLGFCPWLETAIPYNKRIEDVITLVQSSYRPAYDWFRPIGHLICLMLNVQADMRPSSSDIVKQLWANYRGYFCPQCKQSLPTQSGADFPPEPLNVFHELRRTRSVMFEEMMSDSTPVDHLGGASVLRENVRTPTQNHAAIHVPLSRTVSSSSQPEGNPARNSSPLQSRNHAVIHASKPVYDPGAADFPLLKRSSTVLQNRQITPRASASPPPMQAPLNQEGTPSPTLSKAITASPKTYAMALAGDREMTPVAATPPSPPTLYQEYNEVLMPEAELHKHGVKHTPPFICDMNECAGRPYSFATSADYESHLGVVHGFQTVGPTRYKCAFQSCPKKDKVWSRQHEFKGHLKRFHHCSNAQLDILVHR